MKRLVLTIMILALVFGTAFAAESATSMEVPSSPNWHTSCACAGGMKRNWAHSPNRPA